MKDGLLSVNQFKEPIELTGLPAAQLLLLRLILLEKGTFQTHPDMGVGILSRWRYRQDDDLGKLSIEIEEQIETYLPSLAGSTVELKLEDRTLYVKVLQNNIAYAFRLDEDDETFIPLY